MVEIKDSVYNKFPRELTISDYDIKGDTVLVCVNASDRATDTKANIRVKLDELFAAIRVESGMTVLYDEPNRVEPVDPKWLQRSKDFLATRYPTPEVWYAVVFENIKIGDVIRPSGNPARAGTVIAKHQTETAKAFNQKLNIKLLEKEDAETTLWDLGDLEVRRDG